MEKVLFLWRRGVHRGWVGPPALPLHLGEKRRKPGQDPPRNKGRAAAGCCGRVPVIRVSVGGVLQTCTLAQNQKVTCCK